MTDRRAAEWEALAQREPYFAVLTQAGLSGVESSREASDAYFETGEEDIAALLAAIERLAGKRLRLARVLDFGCGAGRLTLPLARRAGHVIACDIAPTMLAHARRNAESAGLANVSYVRLEELGLLPPASLDFICSLLVFEHIPPEMGYDLLRVLAGLLAPGGVGAVGLPLGRSGSVRRSTAAQAVRRSGGGRLQRLRGIGGEGYEEAVLVERVEACGARVVARFPTQSGETASAVMILGKL